MTTRMPIVSPLTALFLSLAAPSQATFVEAFNGPALHEELWMNVPAGFSASLANGELTLSKSAGAPDNGLFVGTTFLAVGDFVATVEITSRSLQTLGEAGILSWHEFGFTDTFLQGDGQINANIFVQPGFGYRLTPASGTPVQLRVRRQGHTIYEEYDLGSGFVTLHSATHPNLATPVRLGFFLVQSYGNTAAQFATFDNFTIQAAAFQCGSQNSAYGIGLAGTGGRVPQIDTDCPCPGNPLAVSMSQGLPGALSIVAIGFTQDSTPALGGTLLVGNPLFAFVLVLDAAGESTLNLPLGYSSSLFGASLFVQGGVLDPVAPQGVAFSAGLEVVFPRY